MHSADLPILDLNQAVLDSEFVGELRKLRRGHLHQWGHLDGHLLRTYVQEMIFRNPMQESDFDKIISSSF